MTRVSILALALAVALLSPQPVRAQFFANGYAFSNPATDTLSFLSLPVFNRSAIGQKDFVSIDPEGHFAIPSGRIRFFGANCVSAGALPQLDQAPFIARHLSKMGFNLIRFHHLDNPWGAAGSLFDQGSDTRHLNASSLDRMEFFLHELEECGIYADINLHVSRTFQVTDGVPDADSLAEFGKGYTFFDPLLIALQKEYARQLLTHVNPYTGRALANDPVMAMVEITNENSLYKIWRDNHLKPYGAGGILPMRHERLLDSLWVGYLINRYGTTTSLAEAWNAGVVDAGSQQIVNGSFESDPFPGHWSLEQHGPDAGSALRVVNDIHSGVLAAKVNITSADGIDWHMQWKYVGLSITADSSYEIRFAARSDSARAISLSIIQDTDPWTWYAGSTVNLDTTWQSYTVSFHAAATRSNDVRLSFGLGSSVGSYWFDDVSFVRTGVAGLQPGESLESNPPRRIDFQECGKFSDGRVRDMTSFIMKIESDFFSAMRRFLRDTLHVTVPIVGTNWNFGLPDLAVQSALDYMDNHNYWDHPQFPTIPWSSTDWLITNTPMVKQAGGATIGQLMGGAAMLGKPYTVSEYNHPFPNRYQSEGPLFLGAYGGFHDADAVMLFDYNGGTDWTSDFVGSYFDIHRDMAIMSLIPSIAFAFRHGFVAPARQTIPLRLTAEDVQTAPKRDNGGWQVWAVVPPTLPLVHAIRTETYGAAVSNIASLPSPVSPPYVSDTKELTWDPSGMFCVGAPKFAAATGFFSELQGVVAGDLTVQSGSDHGTISWVSLTDEPLSLARRTLLTVSTRTQNTGMVWDGSSTFHDKWGGPPTMLSPLHVTLRLHVQADSLQISPLTQIGGPGMITRTILPIDPNTFFLDLDQTIDRSPWYGINAFGAGVTTDIVRPVQTIAEYSLNQNFPNPFNPATGIRYSVSGSAGRDGQVSGDSWVRLVVYDLLGRQVAVLVDGRQTPGEHEVRFDGGNLSSGVYFYRLTAVGFTVTKAMMLVR